MPRQACRTVSITLDVALVHVPQATTGPLLRDEAAGRWRFSGVLGGYCVGATASAMAARSW